MHVQTYSCTVTRHRISMYRVAEVRVGDGTTAGTSFVSVDDGT